MSQQLIDAATLHARRLYSKHVAQAVIDRMTGDWALREQSETFRVGAVLLAEEILATPNVNDRDVLTRIIADEIFEITPPGNEESVRDRARRAAERAWRFSKRVEPPRILITHVDQQLNSEAVSGVDLTPPGRDWNNPRDPRSALRDPGGSR